MLTPTHDPTSGRAPPAFARRQTLLRWVFTLTVFAAPAALAVTIPACINPISRWPLVRAALRRAGDWPTTSAWPPVLRARWRRVASGWGSPAAHGAAWRWFDQNHDGLPPPAHLSASVCRLITTAPPRPATPWSWVWVSTHRPERAALWRVSTRTPNGAWIRWNTLVNTGVGRSTVPGTYWIYSRLRRTRMRGRFPVVVMPDAVRAYDVWRHSGTPAPAAVIALAARCGVGLGMPLPPSAARGRCWQSYDDPDVQWVEYFNGGDALHAFARAAYGFPQSAGCVEMPPAAARRLYADIGLGTLVTITTAPLPAAPPRGQIRKSTQPGLQERFGKG